MFEKSCGTIPYTIKNGIIHYLLVKALDDGYCGFPKGHTEPNESEEATALRETWKETSINPIIDDGFRYEITYKTDHNTQKTVVYFLAHFKDQIPTHNKGFENFQYLLLPLKEALGELTFENAQDMLKSANDYLAKLRNIY